MIEKVEINGFLTGKNSKNNTLARFKIGGTDLGMPVYNSITGDFYLAFGDTFSDPFCSDFYFCSRSLFSPRFSYIFCKAGLKYTLPKLFFN